MPFHHFLTKNEKNDTFMHIFKHKELKWKKIKIKDLSVKKKEDKRLKTGTIYTEREELASMICKFVET